MKQFYIESGIKVCEWEKFEELLLDQQREFHFTPEQWKNRKGGRIITISSISGVVGNRGQVNYSAAKAGIIGATKALALELAKRNITVNCIAPGIIETDMTSNLPLDELRKMVPLRRLGTAADIAAAASFLMSEGAAYITRQVINVNGGMA